MNRDTLKVTVVIPTYNPGKNAERLARTLAEQVDVEMEVVVIDSSSQDGTRKVWERFGYPVTCIPKELFHHGKTRNEGASTAAGEIIVFMTQDAIPAHNSCISDLVRPILRRKASATFARQLPKSDATFLERFTRNYNYPATSRTHSTHDTARLGIRAYFFSNVCSAIHRDAFFEVGGFPNDVILNEDMVLAAKLLNANHRIRYTAEARVFHSHNYSLVQQFQRSFDIGVAFSEQPFILNGVRARGEGFRFVKQMALHTLQKRQFRLLPRIVLENALRYIAFRLGRSQALLPNEIKRAFSLHKYHWDQR